MVERMYFPATQSVQTEVALYFPTPHVVQIDAPVAALIEPAAQVVHKAVAVVEANVPNAQSVQVEAAAALNLPTAHMVHTPAVNVASE